MLEVETVNLNMTDAELEEIGMGKEEYELGRSAIVGVVGDQGDVLAYFEILVCDANPEEDFCPHDKQFTIRLKLSDEMKGYDTYKLMYVDLSMTADGDVNVEHEDPIVCEIDGDYIVCVLPHLSGYALIGANEEGGTDSPDTGDSIIVYATIFGLSLTAIIAIAIISKRTKADKE